jgi:hypothetical protein
MSWEPINPKKPSDSELIGDEPFDVVADAVDRVVACYESDLGRKPSTLELVKTFERVLIPRFSEAVIDGDRSELVSLSFKTVKIPLRQKFQSGDFLRATAANGKPVYARIFEVHPDLGPMAGVYDSLGVKFKRLEELQELRLIVKITPMHPGVLQGREWIVIGNLPIRSKDRRKSKGPLEIYGNNQHLKVANFYYGLTKVSDYEAHCFDRWLNRSK